MGQYHRRDEVTSRLRLRGHDYASPGSYFVTICTRHRRCLYGEVRDGDMQLSTAGAMIDSWWTFIPARFPSVSMDELIVMPNHLHGVVHIGTDPDVVKPPALSKVIHWFKVRTTYDYTLGVSMAGWPRFPGKLWQTGYYEHILRSERALEQVRGYIQANPGNWAEDDNNPSCIST